MKKRLLSLVLALCLILSVLPCAALAAGENISVTVRFSAPAVAEDLEQLKTDLLNLGIITTDSSIPNEITVAVPSGSTVKTVLEAANAEQNFTIEGLDNSYVTKVGFLNDDVANFLADTAANLNYPGWSFFIDGDGLSNGIGTDTVTEDGAVIEGIFSVYSTWDGTSNAMVYHDVELVKLYHELDDMVKQDMDTSSFSDSAKAAYDAAKSEAETLLTDLYAQAKLSDDVASVFAEGANTDDGMWIGFIGSMGSSIYGPGSPIEHLQKTTEKLEEAAKGTDYGPCDLTSLSVTDLTNVQGSLPLKPVFSYDVTSYTVDAVDYQQYAKMAYVKAAAASDSATITATLGDVSKTVTSGGDATNFNNMVPGENNKLLITVTNGGESKTYTVTIPMKDENGNVTTPDPAPDPDPDPDPTPVPDAWEVMHAIAGKYAADGIAADPNAAWIAADMAAYAMVFPETENKLTDAQKQEYLDKLIPEAVKDNATAGNLAKYIIALRAMGYDARKVVTAGGRTVDVVKKLTDMVDAKDVAVGNEYTLPYVIIALQQGEGYATAGQIAYLKEKALEIKDKWQTLQWGSTDAAPPVVLALSPYYSESAVKAEIDKAVQLLKDNQDEETGALMYGGKPSASSTGIAITALTAIGENPADTKTSSGKSIIDGLMAAVNEEENGFDNAFGTEQGFRGLVAAALQKKTDSPAQIFNFSSMPMETARASITGCPVRFSVVPDGAAVEVKLSGTVQSPKGTNFYDLSAGSYTYTVTKTGYRTASGSFEVTAAEAAEHTEKNITLSLISEPSGGEEEKKLTITVKVLTHDGDACGGKWTYKDNASKYTPIVETTVTVKAGQSAFDAFVLAMEQEGISYTEKSSGYISEIAGQDEFGHGSANSGWQYMIGKTLPTVSCRDYELKSNVTMTWFYTDDYTKEKDSEQWSGGSGGGSVGSGNGSASTQLTPEAGMDKNGEASAKVTDKELSNAIAQAKSDKAEVIVIIPEVKGEASKVSVELPKSGIGDIAKQTGAALKVETEVGSLRLPGKALEDLGGRSGSKVTVTAEVLRDEDGEESGRTRIEIKVDDTIVDTLAGGIIAVVAAETSRSGNVLVVVNPDGSETIIRKSIVDGRTVAGLVDGSCVVRVVDNAKTFADTESHWAKDAVAFVSSHELFQGITETSFAPDAQMNRAMLAVVLYRLENAAEDDGRTDFDDVPEGMWYTAAVSWASKADIVSGMGTGFEPDGSVTREQLVVMLYRYAKMQGLSTSVSGDLSEFSDGAQTSDWARDAMSWAVGSGLISGRSATQLDPTGTATRAEVAAILQRLVEQMVK